MPSRARLLVSHALPPIALALVALLVLAMPAVAGWSADSTVGTPACTATGDLSDPLMVSDGAGGFIVMWTDYRKPVFDIDLYCTRVSAAGDTLWGSGGTVVCDAPGSQLRPTIIADGQGGAFMAWIDLRSTGSVGYYVQHIAANGVRRWAANGIRPVSGLNSQYAPKICLDATGGIYLAFASGSPGTQLQRLDSLGVKKFGAFPPAEGPFLHSNPSAPMAIAADGSGGAIVVLGYGPSGPADLTAQRVSSAGTVLWTAGGAAVCVAIGGQGPVDIVADGSGGALLAWDDNRTSSTNVYAQHMSAAGAAMWATDGIALRSQASIQSGVQLRSLGSGAAVAVWRDYRDLPATDIYAQRLASDGNFVWGSDGKLICSNIPAVEKFTVVAAGSDSTIVAWNTISSYNGDVFAQSIDGAGLRLWGEYGTTVCRGPLDQTTSAAAADGAGGVFVSYRDNRVSSNPDLYANHVGSNGQLGESTTGVPWLARVSREELRAAPNPARGIQRLVFARPLAAAARVEVLDVLGRHCRSSTLVAGASTWTWDGRDDGGSSVPSGVYLVRVTSAARVAIAQVVRLD